MTRKNRLYVNEEMKKILHFTEYAKKMQEPFSPMVIICLLVV